MTLRRRLSILLLLSGLAGCAERADQPRTSAQGALAMDSAMNATAESYVKLVLAVGQHDPDYVDAYYGPPEWKAEAEAGKRPLPELRAEAARLVEELQGYSPASPASQDEMVRLRHQYLTRQLQSMVTRIDMLSGKRLTFDEESQALYDAVAPTHGAEHFQRILDNLEGLLPGEGSLPERIDRFRAGFVIPREKLDAVFDAAIAECRRRTLEHVELPPGESFEVEYVTGKSWSGYNWYKGNFHSLIQVNTDLPIYVDRAIDLACHEGYPGHHVYNMLLEKHLVKDRGWPEFSVYALFSPQSLIAEGTANFGIAVAFPGEERVRFEREKLFPLTGIDSAIADRYYDVYRLTLDLAYAGNEAARGYLDGTMTRQQAIDWVVRYNLFAPARAEQRTKFFDQYRSYVINYNLGQDLVRQYVERNGGTEANPARRWEVFGKLLASPRLPSDLR